MSVIIAISRIILPLIAGVIIVQCLFFLVAGHPKGKVYGYLVDMKTNERYALNTWETSIGKGSDCDIVLGYNSVSRHHASVARRISDWLLFDLQNSADIKVNGKKVEKSASLHSGDTITIGQESFRFFIINDPVLAIGKKGRKSKKASRKGKGEPRRESPLPDFYMLDEHGSEADPAIYDPQTKSSVLLSGSLVTLGRSGVCDLRLSDPTVSRRHANLVLYEDGWAIEDAGSSSGTYLNGVKVTEPRLLRDGDEIRLANKKLYYKLLGREYYHTDFYV